MKITKRQLRQLIREEILLTEGFVDKVKGFFGNDKHEQEVYQMSEPDPEPKLEPDPEPSHQEEQKYKQAAYTSSVARAGLRRTSARKFVTLQFDVTFPMLKQSLEYIKEFEKKYGPPKGRPFEGKSQASFPVGDYYEFEREYEIAKENHRHKEERHLRSMQKRF